MTKTGYKNIFVALLLLAFTSQSFATLVMQCQFVSQAPNSMNMDHMPGMDHSKIDHSKMHHSKMDHSTMVDPENTDSTNMSDCCKTVGHCSSGGCSHAFFSHPFNVLLLSSHADMNISYTSLAPESLASSLFRPPIFC